MVPGADYPSSSPIPPATERGKSPTELVTQVACKALSQGGYTKTSNLEEKKLTTTPSFVSGWEIQQLGNFYTCKQIKSKREIQDLNLKQFPVLQQFQEDIEWILTKRGTEISHFFSALGIRIENGAVCIPIKEELEKNLSLYREKNPKFPALKLAKVDQVLPPDVFLDLMLKNDLIFSKPPELIHDIGYHILPTLIRIFQNPEDYEPYKRGIASLFSCLTAQLNKASSHFEEFVAPVNRLLKTQSSMAIQPEEWRLMRPLLEFSMSGCLDIVSTEEGSMPCDKDLEKKLFETQNSIIVGNFYNWKQYWQKEISLSLSPEDFDKVLEIEGFDRAQDFLKALYFPAIISEIEKYEELLKKRFDEVQVSPDVFMDRLRQKLQTSPTAATPLPSWDALQAPLTLVLTLALEELRSFHFAIYPYSDDTKIRESLIDLVWEKSQNTPSKLNPLILFEAFKELLA